MKRILKKGLVLVPDDFQGVAWCEKMKAAGLNTLGMHSGGGAAHDIYSVLGTFGSRTFQQETAEMGLELEYELHASQNLLPVCHFEKHPEFFMLKLRPKERVKGGNWCVTNPEAGKIVAASTLEIAEKLPSSTHRFFLWGCDAANNCCQCPECARFSASEQALLVSNLQAVALRQRDPHAQACYLTYYATLQAPRLVHPEENVFCEFAPYQRSYDFALNDPRCAVNRQHVKLLLELLEVFGAEKMHVLEYWLDASLWGKPGDLHKNLFNRNIADEDIRFYTSLGIRNITTFGVRMDGAYLKKHGERDFLDYAEILSRWE